MHVAVRRFRRIAIAGLLGSLALGWSLPAREATSASNQALAPGRTCYQLDDEVVTVHVRLDLGDDGSLSGRTVATVHDEANGYYTSYTQKLMGSIEADEALLEVTTWIEYDVQQSRESWSVTAAELRTEQHVLTPWDCATLPEYFDEAPSGETGEFGDAEDFVEYESPVHIRRLELSAGAGEPLAVENSVVRGERDLYLIAGAEGQRLTLKITSLEDNAVFDLVAPAGRYLANESTVEVLRLPENGDYELIVGGTRGNASYRLMLRLDSARGPGR